METLLESEHHYLSELENLILNMLQPLAAILSSSSNQSPLHLQVNILDDLINFHHQFSQALRDTIKNQQGIGALFIHVAPSLKSIFETYCYQHAKLVFIFSFHKDRILNALSKIDPSSDSNNTYIHLIKNLSLPISRLDRYASFLHEYLYNLEEFHADRGDTQRAAEYYAELTSCCAEWRKRKEWELDILSSTIYGIDTDSLKILGEALCLSSATVITENNATQKPSERIAILYPSAILLLSTSANQEEYRVENRFEINQITISKISDTEKNALKIHGPSNSSLILSFPSCVEYHEWCERIYSILTVVKSQIPKSQSPAVEKKLTSTNISNPPVKLSAKTPAWSKGCLRPHSPLRLYSFTALRTGSPVPLANASSNDVSSNANEPGSARALKRFMTMKKSKANEFLKRVETSEGDALLLSVIESYCMTTPNNRIAITSLNASTSKDRSSIQGPLISTNIPILSPIITHSDNRALYDMMCELRLAYKTLQQDLEEEKRARKQLESQIQRLFALSPGK